MASAFDPHSGPGRSAWPGGANAAQRVRDVLAGTGLSERAVARALQVEEATIRAWSGGVREPTPADWRALALLAKRCLIEVRTLSVAYRDAAASARESADALGHPPELLAFVDYCEQLASTYDLAAVACDGTRRSLAWQVLSDSDAAAPQAAADVR